MKIKPFSSTSFGIAEPAVEMYKKDPADAAKSLQAPTESLIEANLWLPAAAKEYKISPKLQDYVIVPIPVMIIGIPNTNGDAVTIQEFLRFNPKMGMQAFKTFRGKPCFHEHDNKNITKAKGVNLDCYIRPLKGFGNGKYWKLVLLSAYDRTKDPMLANSILTKENNAYSIGYYFSSYTCSYCNHIYGQSPGSKPCAHTLPRKPTYELDGRLVYRKCHDVVGFENSSVSSPAFVSAIGPHVMNAAEY
jgi:hypothetical protein